MDTLYFLESLDFRMKILFYWLLLALE